MVKPARKAMGTGFSSDPIAPDSSLLDLVEVDSRSIVAGDYIVFKRDAISVCHRVVRIEEGIQGRRFLTRGDNRPMHDAWVSERAVVARVAKIDNWSTDSLSFRILGRLMVSERVRELTWKNGTRTFVGRIIRRLSRVLGTWERRRGGSAR